MYDVVFACTAGTVIGHNKENRRTDRTQPIRSQVLISKEPKRIQGHPIRRKGKIIGV